MYSNRFIVLAAAVALPCLFSIASSVQAAPVAAQVAKAANPGSAKLVRMFSTRRATQAAEQTSVNFTQPKFKRPRRNGRMADQKVRKRRVKGAARVSSEEIAEYRTLISNFAREYGVPVDLAHAIVTVESNYYPKALGGSGEIGLMQIKPATARGMGYSGSKQGLFNPETNIRFGMKYLAAAYRLGGKTTCGAVLKYNAGHGAKRMNPISSAYCAKVKRLLKQK